MKKISKMREDKFDVISLFDKYRWEKIRKTLNYSSMNINKRKHSNDEILLIHWISYVTNRQMPYKKVFDIGSFVFSDLIYSYAKEGKSSSSLFKINDPSNPFIKKIENKYYFVSSKEANNIVDNYGSTYDGKAKYSPRFMGPDYKSIALTLRILEKEYNKSFIEYVAKIIETVYKKLKTEDNRTKEYVEALAKGLNLLTYNEIGQPKADKNGLKEVYKEIYFNDSYINKRIKEINEWLKDPCDDDNDLKKKKKFEASKRLWCVIRDYIKSPEYSKYFSAALKSVIKNKKIYDDFKKEVLEDSKGCKYVELPGDVWNDNTKFRKCFNDENQKQKLGEVLRDKWKETDKWYPEQFDTTFDFAPRMCEQGKCDICLLNDKRNKEELKLYCANVKGKYCPLLMLHCGYKHKCPGKGKCDLQKNI